VNPPSPGTVAPTNLSSYPAEVRLSVASGEDKERASAIPASHGAHLWA
jgi:hypothetical protein